MEFLYSIFLVAIYLVFKKYGKLSKLKPSSPVYRLSDNYNDYQLTDRQDEIVAYLKNIKVATENEILNHNKTNKSLINNLLEKGVIEKVKFKNLNKREIIYLILCLLILILSAFLLNYFLLVKANLRYFGIFVYLAFYLFVGFNILNLFMNFSVELYKKIIIFGSSAFVVFMIVFFVFGGRTYFHAEAYSNLIEVEEKDFIEDINTVDVTTLPIVDKSYGSKLGSLKLGEYPGIGSEFQPGAYSDIIYQGKQYLVAALEYRGFFKWTSNRDTGTPGYILIDKVTSETTLINLREQTGKGLKYLPSAYFGQDLTRLAYYNGLSKYKLENHFFEIDEEGNPYYILQYSLPTIFINGGNKINKIAIVDVIDGSVEVFNPNEVPDWVESVYPNELIFEQLNYWGSLQDGWLNSVFAQRGVIQTSTGTRVIMNEGELFYFTGMTSAGNDESTIGFIYSNMKTKETRLFRFSGATEEAAMNKALTLIPQNNISTSFPIPLNVQNVPTYFILIKGEDGRILRYVFIKIQDLEFYTISEASLSDAYNNYLKKLNDEDDDFQAEKITGTIDSITSYVLEGNTVYWIEVNGNFYQINVKDFTDQQMQFFISKDVGDSVEFYSVESTVVDFED
jgi:hypothetical protein